MPKQAKKKAARRSSSDDAQARRSSRRNARRPEIPEPATPERHPDEQGDGRRFRVIPDLLPLLVPLDSLVPDPGNARAHPERSLAALRASLRANGQHAPLVVQAEGRVVRLGNGRLAAMKALGWTHAAAVVVEEGDVEASARAIADNRAGDLAIWDGEKLAASVSELRAAGLAEGLEFSEDELARARGEFAAPTNGQEVLGSIADGLRVRASLLVTCPKAKAGEVARVIREAFEREGLSGEEWSVDVRGASGTGTAGQIAASAHRT